MRPARDRVVFLSAFHDYRTSKRASIHQVADGLVHCGYDVAFISTRFSRLSKHKGDSRLHLWDKSNLVERVNGIECFLWRTNFHPFRTDSKPLDHLTGKLFPAYAALPNQKFDNLVKSAKYVVFEAGMSGIYLRRIKRLNSSAKIICYCADRPDTVGSHPAISRMLLKDQHLVDQFVLRSPIMAEYFAFAPNRLYQVGFGINSKEFSSIGPNPYPASSQAAVSVGSMLFDKTFFSIAAPAFLNLQFHVIGAGANLEPTTNLRPHSEMPFSDTLPFVKHASIGIAPYRAAPGVEYLADTSLKLAQFEYFGIPAVCPHFAVGTSRARIGYEPGNEQSIRKAVDAALAMVGQIEPRSFPEWSEVAMRVLEPQSYPDASINYLRGKNPPVPQLSTSA